jgi:hypothetical protein
MDPWMRLPEAPIAASGSLAARFRQRGCTTLRQAAYQLYTLPYGRNSDRSDFLLVLSEGRGTCSTKHALASSRALRTASRSAFPGTERSFTRRP